LPNFCCYLFLKANEVATKEAAQVAKRRQIDEEASRLARQAAEEAEIKLSASKGNAAAADALQARQREGEETTLSLHYYYCVMNDLLIIALLLLQFPFSKSTS
jgi:hypothetical protein